MSIQDTNTSKKPTVNHAGVSKDASHDVSLLISLEAISPINEKRSPVDMVIVLDCSASMRNEHKLDLCKSTLKFLVDVALSEDDQLGLVVFDSVAKIAFECNRMTKENKAKFLEQLNEIQPGDHTNLSGGLFLGLEMLKAHAKNQVSALMLLSDGEITSGVMDRAKLVRMTRNLLLECSNPPAIYTFGYGPESDPVLRDLVCSGKGGFVPITSVENVPLAFSEVLGGLLSVAAQNIQLTVQIAGGGGGGAQIVEVRPKTFSSEIVTSTLARVRIEDMYQDEHRDLLIRLHLPRATNITDITDVIEINVEMNYVDLVGETSRHVESKSQIHRVQGMSVSLKDMGDASVARHIIRMDALEAMDRAKAAATKNDLVTGVREIDATLCSAESRMRLLNLTEEQDEMLALLMCDLRLAKKGMESQSTYALFGSKQMDQANWTHANQRSNALSHGATASGPSAKSTPLQVQMLESELGAASRKFAPYITKGKGAMAKKAAKAFHLV